MTTLVPAIIPENFNHLHDEVAKVKDCVTLVQVDICDGSFVKSKMWPYRNDGGEFEGLLRQDMGLPFWEDVDYEFHLMVETPEKYVEDWITIGASSIIVHVETVTDMNMISTLCKASEVSLGLAIKPSTESILLAPYMEMIDFVQCMGGDNLGHHGETLDPSVYEKIKQLREMYPELIIAIDIGVNRETAPLLVKAGVNKLVSGGAVFESKNIIESVEYFQSL